MRTKINSIEEFKQAEKAMLEQLVEQLKREGFFEPNSEEGATKSISADSLNFPSLPYKPFNPQSFQPFSFSDNLAKNKLKNKKAAKPVTAYKREPPTLPNNPSPILTDPYGLTPALGNKLTVVPPSDGEKMLPELTNRNPIASTYVAPGIHPTVVKPREYLSDFQMAEIAFPADNENFSIEGGVEYKNMPLYSKDIRLSIKDEVRQSNVTISTLSHKDSGGWLVAGSVYTSDTEKSVLIVNPLDNSFQSALVYEHREYLQTGPVITETREVYIDFGNWKKKIVYQTREGVSISPLEGALKKVRIKDFKPGIDFKVKTNWTDLPIDPADQVPPPPDVITRRH